MCTVEGCDQKVHARSMCIMHYTRWKRHGDPNSTNTTPHGEPLKFLHESVLTYKGEDCLWWPYGRISTGYGAIRIDGKVHCVHIIVCETAHGPGPSPEHIASHKCGNGHKGCCNPRHLKWQTWTEDRADMVSHGTIARGSQVNTSKLTEESVRQILSLESKLSQTEIAKRFDVSTAQVNRIIKRKTWAWLTQ